MCGISGVFFCQNNNFLELIKLIIKKQYERGPDSSGLWQNDNIILGHNRLAIRDLNETGHQPLENDAGVLCYNGEIYNSNDLLEEMVKHDPTFKLKGSSDTEILLNYITIFGLKKTLDVINGIYAFAYYDKHENKVYLIRDRMGIKPLYYMLINDSLIFASNLSALFLSVKEILNYNLTLNLESVYFYLLSSGVFEGETFIKNIYKLESASCLEYDLKTLTKKIYWEPNVRYDEITSLLKNSIEINKIADVPVSVLFSGGIDSSIVANYCEGSDGIHLCTDETIYAEKIADKLNINLNKLKDCNYTSDDFESLIKQYIIFSGEPSMACIIPMIVSKELQHKYKVAISGNGGDELFYGYERTPVDELNNVQLDNLRKKQEKILKNGAFESVDNNDYQINHLFRNPENFQINYVDNLSYDEFKKILENKYKLNEKFNNESNHRWLELSTYVKNDLNPTLDFASMLYSIEVRVPFLDYRLIERCLTMTSNDHLNVTTDSICRKNILQDILKQKLDPELIERQKRGFSLPINLATEYNKLGKNSIEKLQRRNIIKSVNFEKGLHARDSIYFTNSCYSLDLWFEEFIDTNIVNFDNKLCENEIFKNCKEYQEVLTVDYYTGYNINIKLKNLDDFNIIIKIESLGNSARKWYWENHFENTLDYFENINNQNISINIPILNKKSEQVKVSIVNKSNTNKTIKLLWIIKEISNDTQRLYNLSISNKLLFKNYPELINYKNIFPKEAKLNTKNCNVDTYDNESLYNFKRHGYNSIYLKNDNDITITESFKIEKDKFYICSVSGFSKETESRTFLFVRSKNKQHYNVNSFDHMLNRSLGHISLILDGNKYNDDAIKYGLIQQKKNKNEEEIFVSKMFCSEIHIDDSNRGRQIICPRKKYEIAVVISMHERNWIVEKNVDILNQSNLDLCIVIICSLTEDYVFCKKLTNKYNNVYYYKTENNFIGCKWQCGFLYAKLLNPNYVIITGSDDLLLPTFIKTLYNETLENDCDLCGVRNWSIYNEENDTLYDCNYTSKFGNNELLLGAGRIYSAKLLNRFNWNVHEHLRDKCLDDLGFYMSKIHDGKIKTLYIDYGLISYKGNWDTMNSFDKILEASKKLNSTINIKENKNKLHYDTLMNLIK